MPITERTLRKWRKEALRDSEDPKPLAMNDGGLFVSEIKELSNRILRMTQELLDQHLLRKK